MGQVQGILDNSGLSAYIHDNDGNPNYNDDSLEDSNGDISAHLDTTSNNNNSYTTHKANGGNLSTSSRLNLMCGSIGDTLDTATKVRTSCIDLPKDMLEEHELQQDMLKNNKNKAQQQADAMQQTGGGTTPAKSEASRILARALLSPDKHGNHYNQHNSSNNHQNNAGMSSPKATPRRNSGGVTTPKKTSSNNHNNASSPTTPHRTPPPNHSLHPLSEHRAQLASSRTPVAPVSNTITIGLSLSRRHSTVGHPDT
eukprot:CAMPEP_0116010004 /NCGR_PEP_ID=MMETSP0321-20121206/3756_1 /TAXON_ID=163516 /ORGANISM="Leptocylindrus danicus var. danicus, Strain B650" /LENGTH=254 /DNA_ID=CAMNT_0003479047 /DNA_START=311 /DNA_END=1071 /DNA_ORIENTATION=-